MGNFDQGDSRGTDDLWIPLKHQSERGIFNRFTEDTLKELMSLTGFTDTILTILQTRR